MRLAVPIVTSTSGRERLPFEIRLNNVSIVSIVTSRIDAFNSNEPPGENEPWKIVETSSYIRPADTPKVRDFHGEDRAKEAEKEMPDNCKGLECVSVHTLTPYTIPSYVPQAL